MCVYEKPYNDALNARSIANTEIDRCTVALKYYSDWKTKVDECFKCAWDFKTQTNSIEALCIDIILNKKRIDDGPNHYPNGNASLFARRIGAISEGLQRLLDEIDNTIDELVKSNISANEEKRIAQYTIDHTPTIPCGFCDECRSSNNATIQSSTNTASQTPSATTKIVNTGSKNLTM